jgi:hypothetical protein
MQERTEKMREMLAEAREVTWKTVGATKNKTQLAQSMIAAALADKDTHMIPIQVLAKSFCDIVATYTSTNKTSVQGAYDKHE